MQRRRPEKSRREIQFVRVGRFDVAECYFRLDEFVEMFPKIGIRILQGICKIVTTRLRKLDEDYLQIQSTSLNEEGKYGT